ncbi:MAG: hypothetical protein IPI66_07855 [Chitinophagaceae bacterium]|nr:hypothetical protein [Chitinophagaceae bacterium]
MPKKLNSKSQLKKKLTNCTLEIKQGFAYLSEIITVENDQLTQLTMALEAKKTGKAPIN